LASKRFKSGQFEALGGEAGHRRVATLWGQRYDAAAMVPPIWFDDRGQPRPKQPCPRCGREIQVLTLPPELLRFYGWQPFQGVGTVEGCGHRVEGIPVVRRGRVMAIRVRCCGRPARQ
jgi:hypothetical protein